MIGNFLKYAPITSLSPRTEPRIILALAVALLGGCSPPGYRTNGATWSFSPDGSRVAYLAAIDSTGRGLLAVQSVTGGDEVQIAPNVRAGSLRFSPDGSRIAFLEGDSTLFVASAGGGGAAEIATGVGNVWFTPNGERLVFEQNCDSTCALMSAPTAGGPTVELQAAVPRYSGVVGYSIDGTQIVVWDAAQTLWTMPLSGGVPVEIAAGTSGCRVTPDEGHLTFMIGHTLNVARIDGSGRQVLAEGVDLGGAAFSPDGTRAVFFQSGTGDLSSTAPDGGIAVQIATNVREVSFSPDGSQLSLIGSPDSHGFGTLMTMSPTGGRPHQIATRAGRARFAVDGTRLIFVTHWDPTSGSGRLEATSVFGDGAVTIADGAAAIALSPEGGQAAFGVDWDPVENRGTLATAPIAGGSAIQLGGEVSDFRFSPDGRHLGFVQNIHALSSSSPVGVGTIKVATVGSGEIVKIIDQ